VSNFFTFIFKSFPKEKLFYNDCFQHQIKIKAEQKASLFFYFQYFSIKNGSNFPKIFQAAFRFRLKQRGGPFILITANGKWPMNENDFNGVSS